MGELLHLPSRTIGQEPRRIPWTTLARAKRLMAKGLDLYEAAALVNVRPRDLDLSLWSELGREDF